MPETDEQRIFSNTKSNIMITKAPGIEDIFPDQSAQWNHILSCAREAFSRYNYREIIVPVLEFTELFVRGIGTDTDIVSKEMFTFEDRGGRSMTLRPEGTASVVRAYCENGEYNRRNINKFFYIGPMFRAEKPQKGRLRQFNQLGAELFGDDDPYYDFEIIALVNTICTLIGLSDYTILLNSIGCREDRKKYTDDLQQYYRSSYDNLCSSCKTRLDKNPLRLLDCKEEYCSALRDGAPKITDYLCGDCSGHYDSVRRYLNDAGIVYTENPYLVRGLDYYSRTTFEFVTGLLGGQNAFAGGGRYNQLVEELGGKPTPAVGFAAGIERMMLMCPPENFRQYSLDAYIVHTEKTFHKAASVAGDLRNSGLKVDLDPVPRSFKAQMKRCDRENAAYALIIGEDELSEGFCTVKNIGNGEQRKIAFDKLTETVYNDLKSITFTE